MVAPHAGAWIEITTAFCSQATYLLSHPMRVRGLKSGGPRMPDKPARVAPHAGAWIEIQRLCACGL